MKKNLRISLLVFATLIIVVSCRKQDVGNTPSLAGKWYEDKMILWTTIKSGDVTTTKDTTVYTGSYSYIDFRTDGNAYEKNYDFSSSSHTYDTVSYSVHGNALTAIKRTDTTVWTIQILTDNSLQLYRKNISNSGALTSELWLILSR